jgi:hypothetical protein
LVDHLRQQRMALFPNYTNPNLTYNAIVSPVRQLAGQVWGQPVDDETMLIDLANMKDYNEMAQRLREQGIQQGIRQPVEDALQGLMSTSLGERVQRSSI